MTKILAAKRAQQAAVTSVVGRKQTKKAPAAAKPVTGMLVSVPQKLKHIPVAQSGSKVLHASSLAAMKSANPELIKLVANFEQMGGKGSWFTSASPFSVASAREGFYLVSALPPKAHANA